MFQQYTLFPHMSVFDNVAFGPRSLPAHPPGILAGALLAFALSIDDFIITFFNAGSLITFPIQIFGASRVKIPPQINVLASMILIVSICLLGIGALFGARRQRRYG